VKHIDIFTTKRTKDAKFQTVSIAETRPLSVSPFKGMAGVGWVSHSFVIFVPFVVKDITRKGVDAQ
jgi:hypothetical protein